MTVTIVVAIMLVVVTVTIVGVNKKIKRTVYLRRKTKRYKRTYVDGMAQGLSQMGRSKCVRGARVGNLVLPTPL